MIDHNMAITGTGIHEIKRIETACFEGEESSFVATVHAFFANMTSRVTTED